MCLDVPKCFVFGYGSLIWRCGFDYAMKYNGYIKGYKRQFTLVDTYHRGTPNAPGRCVNLIETGNENDIVYGTCYLLNEDCVDNVLSGLDEREYCYNRRMVPVYINDDIQISMALLYISITSNTLTTNTLPLTFTSSSSSSGNNSSSSSSSNGNNGSNGNNSSNNSSSSNDSSSSNNNNDMDNIANIIIHARGMSGTNYDYMMQLYHSLSDMNALDDYMIQLHSIIQHKLSIKCSTTTTTTTTIINNVYNNNHSSIGSSIGNNNCVNNSIGSSSSNNNCVNNNTRWKGTIIIDDGAVQAISNKSKSLLPCGVLKVIQEFERGDIVQILNEKRMKIAIGRANYNHMEINRFKGRHSKYIQREMMNDSGAVGGGCEYIVYRNEMILI